MPLSPHLLRTSPDGLEAPVPRPLPLDDVLRLACHLTGAPAAAFCVRLRGGARLRASSGLQGDAGGLLDLLAKGPGHAVTKIADEKTPALAHLRVASGAVLSCTGMALFGTDQRAIGALCVLDASDRVPGPAAKSALESLARLAAGLAERRMLDARRTDDDSVEPEREEPSQEPVALAPVPLLPDPGPGEASQTVRRGSALASRDPLTGLFNRTALVRMRQNPARIAQLLAAPFTVMLLDIDHFQRVNDRHGRLLGDRALRAVADAVTGAVRSKDVAVRFGGEEFLVVMPSAGAAQSREIAQRIRRRVAEASLPFPLTVSVGVAVGDPERDPPEEVLRRADRALVRAKAGGRDRVVIDGIALPA